MFTRILIGIDHETRGRDAIALARILRDDDSRLTLASVHLLLPVTGKAAGTTFYVDRDDAEKLLADVRAELDFDAEVETVGAPSVGRGLDLMAEAEGADLLVVGSHRHGLLGRVLLGDATRNVIASAPPCAVAVAPVGYADQARAPRTIGVASEDSPEGLRALSVGRGLAGHLHADLKLLTGVADSVDALADASTALDLMVIASHRPGSVDRLLHRGPSEQLARLADCPLVILASGPAVNRAEEQHDCGKAA